MLAASFLFLGLVGAAAAPQDDPAVLLPADTLVYFGSASIKAGAEASRNTAMSRILSEAEVRSFLHEPVKAAEAVLEALMEQQAGTIEQLDGLTGGAAPDDLSFSLELGGHEPLPLGRAFFGLTHVAVSPPTEESGPTFDVGVVVGLELLDDELLGLVRQVWSAFPLGEAGKLDHQGVEVLVRRLPDSPTALHLTVLGRLAVFSTSEKAMLDLIERQQGTRSDGSLATTAEYKALVEASGGLGAGGSSYAVRIDRIAELARGFLPLAMQDTSDSDEVANILAVVDSLGIQALGLAGGVSKVMPDGRIATTSLLAVQRDRPGLLGRLLEPGEGVDVAMLSQVPGEAFSASAAFIGNQLVEVYDFVTGMLERMDPSSHAEAQAMLQNVMGEASLRDDILANVGGRMLAFSQPGQNLMGSPDNIYMVGVKDGGRLVSALEQLFAGVAEGAPNMPVKLKAGEHKGTPFYEIDLSGTPFGMMMQPAFALPEGKLVASNSQQHLRTWLDDGLTQSGTLADNEKLVAFVQEMAGRGVLQSFAYGDNAGVFATTYGQLVGAVQVLGATMGELPVDLSKLPSQDAIAKHLGDTYTATAMTRDGQIVTRSIGQFQLSDFVPLAIVGGLVAYGHSRGLDLEPGGPAEIDPLQVVQNDLQELKASMTVYKIGAGAYPESLEDLVQPLEEFPEGAYSPGVLPVDPWGNGYHYTLAEKNGRLRPKIWSAGPNGIDEDGAGDDIVAP